MDLPLVSIVLPTRNGRRFIEEAVQSCIDQTYLAWELIIVDDASEEESASLACDLAGRDARIRLVRNAVCLRLPGSLNVGFRLAKGNYLTWISDDNYYRPEALSEMVAILENNPEIDLVYCDYTEIDANGHEMVRVEVKEPHTLCHKNCVGFCFLYRRSLQESVGAYCEACFLAEDYEFWLRASRWHRFLPLHQDLYCRRRHENSLSSTRSDEARAKGEQAVIRHMPKLEWMTANQRADVLLMFARRSLHRRHWTHALLRLTLALCNDPSSVAKAVTLAAVRKLGSAG